jgi:Flp pilus assembly secretin CpaC
MLEACRHLEQAGMKDQANELRKQCMAEVGNLARRLKAAEAELADLRKSASGAKTVHRDMPTETPCSYAPEAACCKPNCEQGKPVVVEMQMLEIDRSKLQNMDLYVANAAGEPSSFSAADAVLKAAGQSCPGLCDDTCRFGVLENTKELMGFLDALKQAGAVEVLSQPTVMTMSGRPAAVQVGSEFPVPSGDHKSVEYRTFGTELNLLPQITEGDKLRLEVRARHSNLDKSREVRVAGHTIPGINVREVDTGVEMKSGQTYVIGGMVSNRTDGDKQTPVELLMIIKPEVVEGAKCETACKAAPCGNCECSPCGNCKPASHEEKPLPMPSF